MELGQTEDKFANYQTFNEAKLKCRACPIGPIYNRVVPSLGQTNRPKVLLTGECPGADEIKEGSPFCGRSGKILRQEINLLGFCKENTLITNTIPCRPKDNHFPEDDSIVRYCVQHWLINEIYLTKPMVIGLIGGVALKYILGMNGITKRRGQWFSFQMGEQDIPCLATFHPSFILRSKNNGDETPYIQFKNDLKLIAIKAEIYLASL